MGLAACIVIGAGAAGRSPAVPPAHNVILFVPDGLRALAVDAPTAPVLAALRDRGVNFVNPHSLLPTVTTPNASAMATGHYFGDTGNFSNTLFAGFSSPAGGDTVTPFLENDAVLGDMDAHFGGNYLHEVTVFQAARAAGLSTAAIGKLGPTLIFDPTDRSGAPTIVIDDSTGAPSGIPLSDEMKNALQAAGLPWQAPGRGENGKPGTATSAGTLVANVAQQRYFVEVATRVVLPLFKRRGQPFLLVFWSRDPDGTQHNQGDSLNQLTPGINGPTSRAAIRNADDNLAQLERAVADLGLTDVTDVIVSADHGFSTISKQSGTSPAARTAYADVPSGFLPPGFLAHDLSRALELPWFDPDNKNAPVMTGAYPKRGNGLLGVDPRRPDVVVAANGGSDLVYLPNKDRRLSARVIEALLSQDYVSGLFVDDALGSFKGTLPLSAIGLKGSAVTPTPSIVIGFRTSSTECAQAVLCAVEVADSLLQQGQGMHGTFSRADTMNFMAAAGPDFKARFTDAAPTSNADVGRTIAFLLKLNVPARGKLVGRVMTEALVGGKPVTGRVQVARSAPGAGGLQTVLQYQQIGTIRYFDVAGFPGRAVGLER